MKKYWLLFYVFGLISSVSLHAEVESSASDTCKIKVLLSAAIISENYQERKRAYIKNLKLLKLYGCETYVVENCESGPTFLDDYCSHVYYTHSNDPSITKSANEAMCMSMAYDYFNFSPEEMIVKLTGRYILQTDEFIQMVRSNLDADIIARQWNPGDAYTGCFAMKGKYLIDMLRNHYLNMVSTPQYQYYAVEHGLGNYMTLMKDSAKIFYWPWVYDYLPCPSQH